MWKVIYIVTYVKYVGERPYTKRKRFDGKWQATEFVNELHTKEFVSMVQECK